MNTEKAMFVITTTGTVAVGSLAEASKVVREDIEARNMGSIEWSEYEAGAVYEGEGAKPVARISYNGRVWADGKEIEVTK